MTQQRKNEQLAQDTARQAQNF